LLAGGHAARHAAGRRLSERHTDHHPAGNPVSALGSFEVFIRAPLRTAMGLPNPDRARRTAVLAEDLTSPRGKRQFRRGVLDRDAGTVTGYGPPASHHLRWLASANCLLEIDEDVAEVAAGTPVQVWDLT
jgi:molybdopterin molybdotransferase